MTIFTNQSQLNQYMASIQASKNFSFDFYKKLLSDNEELLCKDCSVDDYRSQNRSAEIKTMIYDGCTLHISECGDIYSNDGVMKHYKRSGHYTVKLNGKYILVAKLLLMAFSDIKKPLSVLYKSGIPEILCVRNLEYKHAYHKTPLVHSDFVFANSEELSGYVWSYGIESNDQLLKHLGTSEDNLLGSLTVKRQENEPGSVTWREVDYNGVSLLVNQYGAVKKDKIERIINKPIATCFIKGRLTVTVLIPGRKKMRISVVSLMMRAFHGVTRSKIHVEYLDGNPRNTVLRNIQLIENRYSAKN